MEQAHEVHISVEAARGCGYRKPSKGGVGIYLVSDGLNAPCGLLPLPLGICPCCGGGIKVTRGWTWITPSLLFTQDVLSTLAGVERECEGAKRFKIANQTVLPDGARGCPGCPIGTPPSGLHGLLWVGEKFYPTPDEFMREAGKQGVSRKLHAVPHGFKLGETWVFLAHRKAVRDPKTGEREFPGIFTGFLPRQVDLVISDEHEVPDKAKRIADRLGDGARLVKVVRDIDVGLDQQVALPLQQEAVH